MSVDEDGPRCHGHCPNRGCLEVFASATGVMWQADNLADAAPGWPLRPPASTAASSTRAP